MKNECLVNFYKSLEEELNNPTYVNSLKELIKNNELTKEALIKIILQEDK